jgi:hypothetical protein
VAGCCKTCYGRRRNVKNEVNEREICEGYESYDLWLFGQLTCCYLLEMAVRPLRGVKV